MSEFAIELEHVDKNYRLWGRRTQFATENFPQKARRQRTRRKSTIW